MPKEWYDRGLKYQDIDFSLYKYQEGRSGKNNICSKAVICDNRIFYSLQECANYYNLNKTTLWAWVIKKNPTPQKFIDLGLRYATQEEIAEYKNNTYNYNSSTDDLYK